MEGLGTLKMVKRSFSSAIVIPCTLELLKASKKERAKITHQRYSLHTLQSFNRKMPSRSQY